MKLVKSVMDNMMPIMMNNLSPAEKEEMMLKMMPMMMKDIDLAELMSHETFQEKMPKCFTAGFPIMFKGFVEHFFPAVTEEEQQAFARDMITTIAESLPEGEGQKLLGELGLS